MFRTKGAGGDPSRPDTYTYDGLGRPLRTDVSDGSWIQHEYNTVDQSTKLRYYYDDVLRTVSYGYSGADNLPSYTTFSSIGKVSTSYDSLTRLWHLIRPFWGRLPLKGKALPGLPQ